MLSRIRLESGPEGLLTDTSLSRRIRSRGFVQSIRDRRQVTLAARRLGPKDKRNAGGGLPIRLSGDSVDLQRVVIRRDAARRPLFGRRWGSWNQKVER